MSGVTIGVLCILILFALLAIRMWVGVAMALSGFIGILLLRGLNQAWAAMFMTSYNNIASYALTVMPMFILMGCVISVTNIGANLFKSMDLWLSKLRGGLSYATVLATGMLGAITGSQLTGAIVMSKVALPEMEKYKYQDTLSCGCIAAASPLGILIPPSNALIIYGILTETSIGQLFIAGIVPGIITILVFFTVIALWCKLNKTIAPKYEGPQPGLRVKFASLKNVLPVIALFLIVMASIYTGFCTVTESGAIGAFGSILIAFFMRELSLKKMGVCLKETAELLGMIMLQITGTFIFSAAITISGLPAALSKTVTSFNVSSTLVMLAIIFLYLILGCVLPEFPMIMMTVPILYPIVIALGFDLIWFGILIVVVMSIGMLTPPVGLTVYTLAGITKKPVGRIFKGVIPFILGEIVVVVVLMVWPITATWLPSAM